MDIDLLIGALKNAATHLKTVKDEAEKAVASATKLEGVEVSPINLSFKATRETLESYISDIQKLVEGFEYMAKEMVRNKRELEDQQELAEIRALDKMLGMPTCLSSRE